MAKTARQAELSPWPATRRGLWCVTSHGPLRADSSAWRSAVTHANLQHCVTGTAMGPAEMRQSLWFYGLCFYFQQRLWVIELRVSSVSLCFCLSFLPYLCLMVRHGVQQAVFYQLFSRVVALRQQLPLCLRELWIAINQWHTCFPVARVIAVPGNAEWANTESQRLFGRWKSVSVFLLLYSLLSLFK